MSIIRVFPHRTSMTPDDDYVFIGEPPGLFIPPHDEIHVSCTFSWDVEKCRELQYQWQMFTDKSVKLGGPAFGSPCDTFIPGMYIKYNSKDKVIFTSRGCNNKCSFCLVPKNEGKLKELPIVEGNIIQDNNFLQCSTAHKDKVFEMLRSQKAVRFKGGLQANLIDAHFIENVQMLRISELWLACDSPQAISGFTTACEKLTKAGFSREKIKCYVLIGDDMEENEQRLQLVYKAGAMPFAQLVQPMTAEKKVYSSEWKKFHRQWSRPAATKAHVEKGTSFEDFST